MTDNTSAQAVSSAGGLGAVARFAPLQVTVLSAIFAADGLLESGSLSALACPDIWRHLSVGSWILEHRSVPHNILFSQSAELTWVDSSWLFDALTAVSVKIFGLRGLPLLAIAFLFAIAVAVFVLARGARRGFWSAALLTALALYLLVGSPLRSSLASVLLFAVALALITTARSTGNQSHLYGLPPLLLLWANLDIQFLYGVMAIVLFSLAEAVETFARRSRSTWSESVPSPIPLSTTAAVAAASLAATLCNPYGYHLWGAALRSVSLFAPDFYILEMHSLRFRQPQDYVLLLLVMTAFFAIGRRRARDLYSIMLLSVCSVISFHLQRDAWLVAIAAVAVLSRSLDATVSGDTRSFDPPATAWVLHTASVAALMVLTITFSVRVPYGHDVLLAKVSEKFPVRASDYVRRHNLPRPLFNSYDWGSFVTWYLPEYPVAIDNRTDAYGADLTLEYFKVTTGQVPLQSDPALSGAATILLESDSEMGKALSTLPGYKQVYLDTQAMVLVREE